MGIDVLAFMIGLAGVILVGSSLFRRRREAKKISTYDDLKHFRVLVFTVEASEWWGLILALAGVVLAFVQSRVGS